MTRLLEASAARYRTLGRVGGSVVLVRLSSFEARTLQHLGVAGRGVVRAGADARVELLRLDRALADAGGLLRVLDVAGCDLVTETQRRLHERSLRDAAWDRAMDAAGSTSTSEWVQALRETRGGTPPAALFQTLVALELLDRDDAAWDRARLATAALGDPHGFDEGAAASALLVAALAYRDGVATPAGAASRRALLARHGVLSDPHSSTVLVLGLRVTGRGPAAKQLAAADGAHAVLTFAQIAASELKAAQGPIRTSEGPVVVRAAEERFGQRLRAPLVCTDGQPSAACGALLRQLSGRVLHSGDFEWGGLRIASVMRRRHGAVAWRHGVADYEAAAARLAQRATTLDSPRGRPPEGVEGLWRALDERRLPVWQEDLVDELLEDLAAEPGR